VPGLEFGLDRPFKLGEVERLRLPGLDTRHGRARE
jgi:hypothetical protein